jgi:NTE family protein
MGKTYSTGVVLSGGGVKGMAHLGALKALQEEGFEPKVFSGSSVGAVISAFLAAGSPPDAILEFFQENKTIFRWQNFSLTGPGIMNTERYEEMFEPWFEGKTFESLDHPLFICATDILKGNFRIFSEGDLIQPILASVAVPGFFTPVEIEGAWYVDGGVMNNFPIEPLQDDCQTLLGIFVAPIRKFDKKEITNSIRLWQRASNLSFAAASLQKFDHCHCVIYPQSLWNYGLFDTGKLEEIYQLGYQFTRDHMDRILKALDSSSKGKLIEEKV